MRESTRQFQLKLSALGIDKGAVNFENIDHRDAPDFVDAICIEAYWGNGDALTDAELDELNDDGDLRYSLLEGYLY